jgi:4-hydroxy-tetrahydrodipicolinate synthase
VAGQHHRTGWQLYLCSTPPFLLQTAADQRINDYTRLAFEGNTPRRVWCATPISGSLFGSTHGTPQAYTKYWLAAGQVGPGAPPAVQPDRGRKAATRDALARSV